jgi:hypothetical protein
MYGKLTYLPNHLLHIVRAWLLVMLLMYIYVLADNIKVGCGMAQLVARRLAVRQARVRFSARHPKGGPLPSGSNEEIKSGARRVVYIKILYVCSINVK